MSESARSFQAQATRAPRGYAYRVKGGGEEVDFDGFEEGVLLEAKGPGYAKFLDEALNVKPFFKGAEKLMEQAQRQLTAAPQSPIRWIVAEEKFAAALKNLFSFKNIDIEVVYLPPVP